MCIFFAVYFSFSGGSCPSSAIFTDFSSVLCVLWVLAYNHVSLMVFNMSFLKVLHAWLFILGGGGAWNFLSFSLRQTHTVLSLLFDFRVQSHASYHIGLLTIVLFPCIPPFMCIPYFVSLILFIYLFFCL